VTGEKLSSGFRFEWTNVEDEKKVSYLFTILTFFGSEGMILMVLLCSPIGKSTTSCESSSISIFWSRNLFTTLETSTKELNRGIGCKDSLRKLALKPSPTVIWEVNHVVNDGLGGCRKQLCQVHIMSFCRCFIC
jgi:hypothetical protein